MPTTVTSKIGATNSPVTMDYSTVQSWEDASPSDLTVSRSNTTVTGATNSTIILDASASGTNDYYKGHAVWCDARSSEKRLITAYNGTTKVATIGALNGSNATWDNTPGIEAYTIDSVIWQGECYDQGELVTTVTTIISGQATSSTCRVKLVCASGAGFRDKTGVLTNTLRYNAANGVALRQTSAYLRCLYVTSSNVDIIGLQIKTSSTGGYYPFDSSSSTSTIIDSCITESNATGAANSLAIWPGTAKNCLIICNAASPSFGLRIGYSSHAYSCTIVKYSNLSSGGTAVDVYSGTGYLQNCAVFGFSTMKSGGGTLSPTYCATDISSPPSGFTGSLTFTSQFEGTTSSAPDFRAKSTGSLDLNGTPDSTNTPNDIVGQTRHATTPTIGCWEVVEASGQPAIVRGRGVPGMRLGGTSFGTGW